MRALFPTAIRSVPMGVYADNPAIMRGDVPVDAMAGDHVKVVEAMIETARLARPPRRLLLGTDAYELVHGVGPVSLGGGGATAAVRVPVGLHWIGALPSTVR